MNLPNRITMARIVLSVLLLVMLLMPWYSLGVEFPVYQVATLTVNLKYIIAGIIFLIASTSDFLDGYLARKNNMVTDFGKVMDAIADKLLVNGLLIILAYDRIISIVIPVVIISRDIVVDSCKMISGQNGKVVAASIMGKLKTICMMSGLTLTMFYNLPFELVGFPVADILLIAAVILSVISGAQYFYGVRDILFPKKSK
ncbi:CDP-diacylglycerol--glycerol-3-phosphate 3-phosphatidyltransferase [bacterium]|jgi:CDP-diacylglycerol--glycerol-3-phosphate 3-phosphatidyltransferase|nr:CDP-diacylglycerol--glycerol-3-phosphate 3-phosphatidyltransferase [bacterium]